MAKFEYQHGEILIPAWRSLITGMTDSITVTAEFYHRHDETSADYFVP